MLDHAEHATKTRRLFDPGQRIVVAVSGGVDSMVLLDVLEKVADQHQWRLMVAHFNHQLRGRSSDADERLVRRTARRLKLSFTVERADVRTFARQEKISIEMAARQLRHDFLARVAVEDKAQTIALAHHADDQVELFFLRLLRGSGTEALAGMKWRSPSPANRQVMLVRPLLDQPKSALLDYARANGIAFREDASNACLDIQRNRIRSELLPLLRKHYQPAITPAIRRLMEVVGAEAEAITEIARHWLQAEQGGKKTGKTSPPRVAYSNLPVAVQRRGLQLQLQEQGITSEYQLIERLRLSPGRRISVGNVLFCFRDAAGILHVEHGTDFNPERMDVELSSAPKRLMFQGVRIELRVRRAGAKPRKWKLSCEYFDADRVGSAVTLRHWRPGDRFQPIGMKQPAKLQDLFTNQKIRRAERRHLVLATTAGGDIFWVENMRISERFKLTRGTIRRLQWTWQRL